MDLKAKLIEHFRAPFHQEPRRVQALRELCESDFERDMFDVLTHEGFRVQPQVQAGAYRIDLVVEGAEDTCAASSRTRCMTAGWNRS